MKEQFIFFALITLILAGCAADEKTNKGEASEDHATDTVKLPADQIAPEEKANIELNDTSSIFNKSEDNALSEEQRANEELKEKINRDFQEAINRRDANKTPDITPPLMPPATTTTQTEIIDTSLANSNVKVEVYHFHGNSQCSSCRAVGAYAEETINTYFSDELKTGRLVFAHVNYELPENKALAEKYDVTGSSLWIGTYNDGKFSKEENVNVWYKINNKGDYLAYLKGVVEAKLA
jgi:hypothetical protein